MTSSVPKISDNFIAVSPQNLEAERAVLGAILLDNKVSSSIKKILDQEAFYHVAHRIIYSAMLDLNEHSKPIDLITLRNKLRTKGLLEKVGGSQYILALVEDLPTSAGDDYYAQIVLEHYHQREAIRAGEIFLEALADGEHLDKAREYFVETLDRVAHSEAQDWDLIDACTLTNRDYSTDWVLHGVIPKGGLTLLVGHHGLGKSWWSLGLAKAAAHGGEFVGRTAIKLPVVLLDFENAAPILADRLKALEVTDILFPDPLKTPPPNLDTSDWESFAKIFPPQSLVIVDSLRACQSGDENDSGPMIAAMTKLLKLRDKGHSVLVLHHTPKSDRTSARGSTAIPASADQVLNLVRSGNRQDDSVEGKTRMKLNIIKTRFRSSISDLELEHHWSEGSFVVVEDHDADSLELVRDIIIDLCKKGDPPTKTQLEGELINRLSLSRNRTRRLLTLGEGRFWSTSQLGRHNATIYKPANRSS